MSTEDDDTIPPEELEMVLEEFTGKDTQGEPADRIKAIKGRIAYLKSQMAALDDAGARDGVLASAIAKDLADAWQQLARLQANHEGRN